MTEPNSVQHPGPKTDETVEPTDDLRTAIARPIYDILEGPVNNQDFGRQTRQWEMSLLLADAAIAAYRAHPDGAAADLGAAAMLRDPAALHINLLRGNYLTREQLLHLGGEAAQIAAAEATARAEKAEAELLATLQREAASIKRWDDKRDELEARLEKAEAERNAYAAALREIADEDTTKDEAHQIARLYLTPPENKS